MIASACESAREVSRTGLSVQTDFTVVNREESGSHSMQQYPLLKMGHCAVVIIHGHTALFSPPLLAIGPVAGLFLSHLAQKLAVAMHLMA